MRKLKEFYDDQEQWMRSMIRKHPKDEDAFWRHVSYILSQFDGLCAGYRAAASSEWVTSLLIVTIGTFCYVKPLSGVV